MFEQPFLSSEIKSPSHCELLLLARNRIPFLNTGVLFLAGYGQSTFLPEKDLPNALYQPYWSFQLITKGTLLLADENKRRYNLKKGDFFITRPGHTYHLKNVGDSVMEKRYIMVSHGVLVTLLCDQGMLADQTVFTGLDTQYIMQVFDNIRTSALAGGENLQRKLSGMVYDFLLHLLPETPQKELPGGLSKIIEDIHANITERFTLKTMAEKYNTGERTLSRLFLKYMNCTPIQYVIRTRLMYAKQLLRSEGLGIENIARVCGYKSFAFFSKEFKRFYGCTPGEYRKEEIISEKKVTEMFHTLSRSPLLKTQGKRKKNDEKKAFLKKAPLKKICGNDIVENKGEKHEKNI